MIIQNSARVRKKHENGDTSTAFVLDITTQRIIKTWITGSHETFATNHTAAIVEAV
jgi:hypothetical protein